MSTEVFELVQEMDLKDVSTQLVLQCSPLITGITLHPKSKQHSHRPSNDLRHLQRYGAH